MFCACVDGAQGLQECRSDGTFGSCLCPETGDAGTVDVPRFDVTGDLADDGGEDGAVDPPNPEADASDDPDPAHGIPDGIASDTIPDSAADSSIPVDAPPDRMALPDGPDAPPDASLVDATGDADIPETGIRLVLVWETPTDPTRDDDSGSDVDLHFIRGLDRWNLVGDDCFSLSRSPNWGDPTRADDDPRLDADDADGWGPETITLTLPGGISAAPMTYSVGVHYYADHFYGPSDATVRIYLDGVERFASTLDGLEDGQFWDVARIVWPAREVIRIEQLYPDGFP